MAFRKYTQEEYDDATERISKLVNINEVDSVQELDRRLKKNEVYEDAKGGAGTIYKQLVDEWKEFIKPSEKIRQELQLKKPSVSKRTVIRKQRAMKRTQGISYLENENRIKSKTVKGEVKQYVLHKKRYHSIDNIIIYSRTYESRNRLVFKWHTRRKRITVKYAGQR